MQDFKKLTVWQKSHALTLGIYRITNSFPRGERFGLTDQMRRSASSIPANIAEGCGRNSKVDFARFLQIAMGSASETEYHLLLARDLDYLPDAEYRQLEGLAVEIKRMLTALIQKLLREAKSSR